MIMLIFFTVFLKVFVIWYRYLWSVIFVGKHFRCCILWSATVCAKDLAHSPSGAETKVCDGQLKLVRSKQHVLQFKVSVNDTLKIIIR
jgi:hypothetical protein